MIIQVGNTTSSNNTMNKDFSVLHYFTCNVITPCNIVKPSVVINNTSLKDCNYCYIPEFNRYYYITNYEFSTNKFIKLDLRVDVLMSFKDQILRNTAIINRQANDWNLYLNDGSLKTYQNNVTDQYKCSGSIEGESLVLAVSGGNNNPIDTSTMVTPIHTAGGGHGGSSSVDDFLLKPYPGMINTGGLNQ